MFYATNFEKKNILNLSRKTGSGFSRDTALLQLLAYV